MLPFNNLKNKSYLLIDFTEDYIFIKKYPDQVLVDTSFKSFISESQQSNKTSFGSFQKTKELKKFRKKKLVTYKNFSFENLIAVLQTVKEKKQFLMERRAIISTPPNAPKEDIESIRDVLELLEFQNIFLFDRMLLLMAGLQINNNDKVIFFYITNHQCYRAVYFSGGFFDPTLLNIDQENITNEEIGRFVLEVKNKSIAFPNDFSLLKKKQKDIFDELVRDWQKGYSPWVYVFGASSLPLKNLYQDQFLRIYNPTHKLAMVAMEAWKEKFL